jgi:hypothetical protein
VLTPHQMFFFPALGIFVFTIIHGSTLIVGTQYFSRLRSRSH